MIKQEKVKIAEKEFLHTYSDKKFYILQIETNYKYDEAYDVIPCRYTYEETEEPLEEPPSEQPIKETPTEVVENLE